MLTVFLYAISAVFAVAETCSESCEKYNSSCKYQLAFQNISVDVCDILYINGSIEDSKLPKFEINYNANLGEVKLKSFIDYGCYSKVPLRTALNVTFHNIRWDSLRLQCKDRSAGHPFRRKFLLSPGEYLPSDVVIYFDCPWVKDDSENREFEFKYEARNSITGLVEGRKYIFRLPYRKEIDPDGARENWKVFSYVDTSASTLTVHWLQPPFHVKYYVVDVISSNTSVKLLSKIVEPDPAKDVLALDIDAGSFIDDIYIEIKIENYTESISRTPTIPSSRSSPNQIALYLTIGIVFFGAAAFFIIFGWRRSEYVGKRPTVLILYKHTRDAHSNAVRCFAVWLEEVTNAEVLLDIIHVRLSQSKDPSIWYQQAFKRADYILVVASPVPPERCLQEGIYPNVGPYGLRLLADNYSNCRKQFFTVVFPYCNEKDIPPHVTCLICFKLMAEAKHLVWHLTHRWDHWFYKLPFSSIFLYCNKSADLISHYKPLKQSFKDAAGDLDGLKNSYDTEEPVQISDILQQLSTVKSVPNSDDEDCKSSIPDDQDEDDNHEYPGDINRILSSKEQHIEDDQQSLPNSDFDVDEYLLQSQPFVAVLP